MANSVKTGPRLVDVAGLRDALQERHHALFHEVYKGTRVGFVIPLARHSLRAYDSSSVSFANGQKAYGRKVGFDVRDLKAPQHMIEHTVLRLGRDALTQGIILGVPVPVTADRLEALRSAIPVSKDIEGANPESPLHGRHPTASGMLYIAENEGVNLGRAKAVVVGAKGAVGSTLMAQLEALGAEPIGIDRNNEKELPKKIRGVDVVYSAANSPGIITSEMLSEDEAPGLVIDAAIIRTKDGTVGSVDPSAYKNNQVRSTLTEVPGGVGLLNQAMVAENLLYLLGDREAAL